MKKHQRFLAALTTAALLFSLAGCGGGDNTAAPDAGSTADSGSTSPSDGAKKTVTVFSKKREWNWDKIESSFEASNPGYDLVVNLTEATTYFDELKSFLATGDLPDVIQTNSGSLLNLWKEHLVDLSDLEVLSKMDQDILNEYLMDGKYYGVPLFAEFHGVIYNMEYLGKAGISEVPKTLDEFIAMNDALQAAGQPTGIAPWKNAASITGHMTAPLFTTREDPLGYLGQIESGAVDLTQDPLWNGLFDYLDAVRTYGNKDALNTDNTTERNAMFIGQYAWYAHDGSWVTPSLRSTNAEMEKNLRMGVYPFTNDASQNKIGVSTQSLSIMNTKNVDNAKVFVNWLLGTDEGCDILAKDCNVVLLRQDYKMDAADIGELAAQGLAAVEAGDSTVNFRWIADEIQNNITSDFQKYISDAMSRTDALTDIQAQFASHPVT